MVEFIVVSENETQIVLSHLGWTEAPQWQEVFDYFYVAWDYVLKNLSESFN